jgi:hypothetical protein
MIIVPLLLCYVCVHSPCESPRPLTALQTPSAQRTCTKANISSCVRSRGTSLRPRVRTAAFITAAVTAAAAKLVRALSLYTTMLLLLLS